MASRRPSSASPGSATYASAGAHGAWHALFDDLCNRAGHFDNAALASAYCQRIGQNGSAQFEAIQRNLRHWRQGRRLPLRRNLQILADILDLHQGSDTHRRWVSLYAVARGDQPADTLAADDTTQAASAGRTFDGVKAWRSAALLGAAACLLLAAISAYSAWSFHRLPIVKYQTSVTMKVGETRLLNGARGACYGRPPPDWLYTQDMVPTSGLGAFSDGGLGRKWSVVCDRFVPVRAVRFTAQRPGQERIKLVGDLIALEVLPNPIQGSDL